jgi:type II secretory pathway pseudopilin PulG
MVVPRRSNDCLAMKPGTTLSELLFALTIAAILCTIALPSARRGLDGLQVRTARESAFGIAMRTRALALARGGAELVVDLDQRSISAVDVNGIQTDLVQISAPDVAMLTDGAPGNRIVLRYDAHGLGRMASRTLRFRKGSAEAGLTFSSYGRVRRW